MIASPSSHSASWSSFFMDIAGERYGRCPCRGWTRSTYDPGRMVAHPRPAPPRRERLEPEEPVHRLGRRRPHGQGRGRGAPRRRAARRARPAARRRAHVAAAAGDPHRRAGARRRRPAVDPGAPLVAAERAPLRRAAGQGQGADAGRVRRGAVHAVAPLVRHAAAAARPSTTSSRSSTTPATRRCRRRSARAPSASPTSSARMLPYWYDAIVPDLAARRDRCSSPPTATACARSSSTSTG